MEPPANGTDSLDDVMEVVRNDMEPFIPPIISTTVPTNVFAQIIEQPAPKALRFRYECEGRSAGSIPGKSSTADNKTFPSIQVHGWSGRAVVLVSCVSKEHPYKPHPHNLVGKEPAAPGAPQCKDGVCSYEMQNASLPASFPNLGIQCVKRRDIEEALRLRQRKKVDPFRSNFSHINQPNSIDLNCVRLCFQVFLEGPERNKFMFPLKPVVSDPIYDKKATADLVICKLSHSSCSVMGGTEVILLCEKVTKEDISIRFYEEDSQEQLIWEGYAEFTPANVHKQVAISFKTPQYRTLEISEPVSVWIELRRPSDGECSVRRPFQYFPIESDPENLKEKESRKRRRYDDKDEAYKHSPTDGMHAVIKREPIDAGFNAGLSGGHVVVRQVYDNRSPSPNYNRLCLQGMYQGPPPATVMSSMAPPVTVASDQFSQYQQYIGQPLTPVSVPGPSGSPYSPYEPSATSPYQPASPSGAAAAYTDMDSQSVVLNFSEELRRLDINSQQTTEQTDSDFIRNLAAS